MTTKPESHLHEELVSSVAAYDGRFLKIRNDTVRLPNGNTSTREYVVHPGAVVVIPLLDDGRVLLERQFRYPIGRVMTGVSRRQAGPGRGSAGLRQARAAGGNRLYRRAMGPRRRAAPGDRLFHRDHPHLLRARPARGPRQLDQDEFLDVISAQPSELYEACAREK